MNTAQNWTTDHREWYRTVYLQSDHWKDLRSRKLTLNPKCERCQAKACDVHHVNYRRIFDVRISDLLSLCRPCHEEEHRVNGMPKRKKVSFFNYYPPKIAAAMKQRRIAIAQRSIAPRPKKPRPEKVPRKQREKELRAAIRADRKAHGLPAQASSDWTP